MVVDVEVDIEQQVLVDADLRLIEVLARDIRSVGIKAQYLRRAHRNAGEGIILIIREVPAIAADDLELRSNDVVLQIGILVVALLVAVRILEANCCLIRHFVLDVALLRANADSRLVIGHLVDRSRHRIGRTDEEQCRRQQC